MRPVSSNRGTPNAFNPGLKFLRRQLSKLPEFIELVMFRSVIPAGMIAKGPA